MAASVALTADVPHGLTLGVLVSFSSREGQGAEWNQAVQGAAVAAQRFSDGGTDVNLVVADDQGNADRAVEAVRDLAEQGVSGVIVGTSGDHLLAAEAEAERLSLPMILPYASDAVPVGATSWATGPTSEAITEAVNASLADSGVSRTLLITDHSQNVAMEPVKVLDFSYGNDVKALRSRINKVAHNTSLQVDSVLVVGPATQQAMAVLALQQSDLGLPIRVTPEARSPVFAQTLSEEGGALTGGLITVGPDDDDPVALRANADGRAMSAFLLEVRTMANNSSVQDLYQESAFADVAATADVASHDAVVSLVRGVEKANSLDAGRVTTAMETLALDHADGLAGRPLTFAQAVALDPTEVVPLASTLPSAGLRPGDRADVLDWFGSTES